MWKSVYLCGKEIIFDYGLHKSTPKTDLGG